MAVNLSLFLTIAEIVACGSHCGCLCDLWDESCVLLVTLTVVVSVTCEVNPVTCASFCRPSCSCSCNCGSDFSRSL